MAKPLPPAKRDPGSDKELFGDLRLAGFAASLGPRPGAIILNGVLLNSFFPGTILPSNPTAAERQKITSEQAVRHGFLGSKDRAKILNVLSRLGACPSNRIFLDEEPAS
jgi:hypothetical protein